METKMKCRCCVKNEGFHNYWWKPVEKNHHGQVVGTEKSHCPKCGRLGTPIRHKPNLLFMMFDAMVQTMETTSKINNTYGWSE